MNAEIDITGVRLRTPRLILRPWRAEDLADFYEYASVDGVGQMAGWTPHRDMEESRAILTRFIEGKKTFALELDHKAVGSLGVERYDEDRLPQCAALRGRMIGCVLAKPCWGKGLMPEAVTAVLGWLFTDQGLDFVTYCHFDWNRQSARVAQKCGFRPVGEGTYETRYGTVERDIINLLTREEWLNRPGN